MEYTEAREALQEFIDQDEFEELEDDLTGAGRSQPRLQHLGDRAIFYLQIENSFSDEEYSRVALAEYRDGEEYPVPFSEDDLAGLLDGTGKVTVDESLVDGRDVNYTEQRNLAP